MIDFYCGVLGFEQVEQTKFSRSHPPVEATIGLREPSARMAMLRTGKAYVEV